MDITTSKNIAFSLFTFAPVLIFTSLFIVFIFIRSLFNKKTVNYFIIYKQCFLAMFYQFLLLASTTLIFYLFYLYGAIKFIPLIVFLPLSTIISIVLFLMFYLKKSGEIYT